jgi:hypothetical protein
MCGRTRLPLQPAPACSAIGWLTTDGRIRNRREPKAKAFPLPELYLTSPIVHDGLILKFCRKRHLHCEQLKLQALRGNKQARRFFDRAAKVASPGDWEAFLDLLEERKAKRGDEKGGGKKEK